MYNRETYRELAKPGIMYPVLSSSAGRKRPIGLPTKDGRWEEFLACASLGKWQVCLMLYDWQTNARAYCRLRPRLSGRHFSNLTTSAPARVIRAYQSARSCLASSWRTE
jgi:hypothetical protein